MALNRRTGARFQASIWPGFVDAMTGLLLVLMFVLTIFTVIQFVLMETISGQEDEMGQLTAEVSALADALGLERDRTAQLTTRVGALETTLDDAEAQVAAQTAMIASLRNDLAGQTAALNDANARITAFEDQVAALLSEKADALGRISDLEASEAELLSEQEALNLALATARDEIDAQVEAVRLAAAREEALNALVDDLRSQNAETSDSLAAALAELAGEQDKVQALSQELFDTMDRLSDTETALLEEEKAKLEEQAIVAALRERLADTETALSEEEKARIAEAAAAEALRERLLNAQTELTAMTLALEEKRKEAEETLTLLAAANAAEEEVNNKLAAALLANAELDFKLKDTQSALDTATQARDDAGSKLSSVEAALVQALLDLEEGAATQTDTQAQLAEAEQELTRARDRERILERQLAALRVQIDSGDAALADMTQLYEDAAVEAEKAQELAAEFELRLAQVMASRDELTASRDDLETRLAAALASKLAAEENLENAADLQEALAKALEAKLAAENALQENSSTLAETEKTLAELRTRLADALLQQQTAEEIAAARMSDAERAEALLATAREELSKAEAVNAESQREMELLNQQVADLRVQMGQLQSLVDESAAKDVAAQVQITALGNKLNTALARATAEERRARKAEEEVNELLAAEKARLEAENKALEKYRSDFFGQLRELIGNRDGVRIVGDRFVFSSEVLFSSGEAELSEEGQAAIANIATLLRDIQTRIPAGIDWIIRVDGHTDNIPMGPSSPFADNWELSQARALSVVRALVTDHGMLPNRMSANGFGEFQPLNPDNTAFARAQNRRIELKLTER